MGSWCSTSKGDGFKNSSSDSGLVANPSFDQSQQLVVGNSHAQTSMVLGGDEGIEIGGTSQLRQSQRLQVEKGNTSTTSSRPHVVLVPHQHTLFCERKQRVCTAVGRCQEMEILKVQNLPPKLGSYHWVRTASAADGVISRMKCDRIPGSERHLEYTLQQVDVDMFIGFCFQVSGSEEYSYAENLVGPILPGPPRLLEFRIEGDETEGGTARAVGDYIGGYEGQSEYWWMRITATGQRSQISEPTALPMGCKAGDSNDPRCHKITSDDIGCTLKAKCRPRRTDGCQGEIFTSKSSATFLAR